MNALSVPPSPSVSYPLREDLATPEFLVLRRAPPAPRSKTWPEGAVAIVDAMGIDDAGIFGDILCARMHKRGVAGLITDGVVRVTGSVFPDTGLPVWASGVAAPASVAGLTFVGWQEPIGCGGRGGVSRRSDRRRYGRPPWVIPAAMVEEVTHAARRAGAAGNVDQCARSNAAWRCPACIRPMKRPGPATRRRRTICERVSDLVPACLAGAKKVRTTRPSHLSPSDVISRVRRLSRCVSTPFPSARIPRMKSMS